MHILSYTDTVMCILQPGFVNDIQFAAGGKFLAAAIGQEHRLGRWWREKDAKNCLLIAHLRRKDGKVV